MDREYITRELPVTLTEVELLQKAKELAKLQQDKVSHEEQAKSSAATFKDRIAGAQLSINILSRDISNGYEQRTVECYWDFDYAAREKRLIRADTCEMVKKQTLSADEMQKEMDLKQ
jgi:hypothetical protein